MPASPARKARLLAAGLLLALSMTPSGSVAGAAEPAAPARAPQARAWTLALDAPSPGAPAGGEARLLLLPYGTESIAVTGLRVAGEEHPRPLPEGAGGVRGVMRMRGRPVALLDLDPGALAAAAETGAPRRAAGLAAPLELALSTTGGPSPGAPAEVPRVIAPEELAALMSAPRLPDGRPTLGQGCYVVVSAPEFAAALTDLIDWKRRSGFDARLFTTDQTGTTPQSIHAFMQNAYDTWENPPLYLLLVGDIDRVPTWMVGGNVADHTYALLDGDDFLADIFVGRFSAKLPSEVAVQVAKTVGYESAPDTTGGTAWFSQALLAAGNYGSTTPVPLSRWIGQELRAVGYTRTDSVYYSSSPSHPWWTGRIPIRAAINRGVTLVSYRGWARGDGGWEPPLFEAGDIPSLDNGWKLPVVFSLVCHTGNFGNVFEDCMGEAWLKAGTASEPKGAVAFVGTPEHWSHSRWNDRMAMGVFEAICHRGLRHFGAIVGAAKVSLLAHFPTEIHMTDAFEDPKESVEYYHHTYSILGDPSLELWSAPPRPLALADLPSSLPAGANFLSLGVQDARTGEPVAGARLAVTQGGALVGYAVTGESGRAEVPLALQSAGPVLLTVTGVNLHPLERQIGAAAEALALTCAGAAPAGGFLVAGAATDLLLSARNSGTAAVASATARIEAPAGVQVLTAETSFGALAPGETGAALSAVRLRVDPGMENGARVRLVMTPTIQGAARTPTEAWLTVSAPAFACTGMDDGGDGRFDPGEEFQLTLTLRNDGAVAGGGMSAALAAVDPEMIVILDGDGAFGEIAPGSSGTNGVNPFRVRIPPATGVGTVIPLRLTLQGSGGPLSTLGLNLVVGAVDFSAPTGPDAYGYYAYDSADIDYPGQAPAYDWVECSPLYGGLGTKLTAIGDNRSTVVSLPFTFTYYGREYGAVRVSDNGWISFDLADWYDIRNWNMPDKWGGSCLVAPFWDNLDPTIAGSDGVCAYHDARRNRFVVQWSRLQNWESSTDDFQTFQLIIHDPAHYATPTGDGEILFQYKQIVNDDYQRMYATVGIEDHTEEVGLAFSHGNQYAPGAAPLSAGLAIKITTAPPVYQPLTAEALRAVWAGLGAGPSSAAGASGGDLAPGGARVEVAWELPAAPALVGLALERAAGDEAGGLGPFARLHEEWLGPGCRDFVDESADLDPRRRYAYRLVARDRFGKVRTLGETETGAAPASGEDAFFVRSLAGTIVPGEARIEFAAGTTDIEELAVYDAAGRRIADLRARAIPAAGGRGAVSWDGRDDAGRGAPAGLYWIRMRADGAQRAAKVLLVR